MPHARLNVFIIECSVRLVILKITFIFTFLLVLLIIGDLKMPHFSVRSTKRIKRKHLNYKSKNIEEI